MTTVWPECAGPQLPGHPKGPLVFNHNRATCFLGRAEDATADADLRCAADWFGPFARPVTDTEKTLLAAVGIDPAVIEPWTNVTPVSPGVIRRHWTKKKESAA